MTCPGSLAVNVSPPKVTRSAPSACGKARKIGFPALSCEAEAMSWPALPRARRVGGRSAAAASAAPGRVERAR